VKSSGPTRMRPGRLASRKGSSARKFAVCRDLPPGFLHLPLALPLVFNDRKPYKMAQLTFGLMLR